MKGSFTPSSLPAAASAVITPAVSMPPARARPKSYTNGAHSSNSPLLKPADWGHSVIPVYVDDSSWTPGPEDTQPPLFKQEEGTPFSVAYGYESWPICVGPATGCLKLSVQAWLSTNSLNSNYTKI